MTGAPATVIGTAAAAPGELQQEVFYYGSQR